MQIKQRITDDQALDLVKNGGRLEWFDNGTTSHRVNSETGEHEITTTVKKAFQIFKDGYYYHVNKTTAKKICHENGLDLRTLPESLKWSSVASVVKPENVFNVVARKNGRISVMTGSPESFRACQVIISKLMDSTRPYCSIEPIAPVVAFYDLPKSFQDRAYRDRQGSGEDYTRKRYFVIGGDLYCRDDIEEEHGARMNSDAKKAVVKFSACGLIAGFTVIAIIAGDGGGLFRPILYTVAGGVCCGLIWPTQDQGDALLEWIKDGRR